MLSQFISLCIDDVLGCFEPWVRRQMVLMFDVRQGTFELDFKFFMMNRM